MILISIVQKVPKTLSTMFTHLITCRNPCITPIHQCLSDLLLLERHLFQKRKNYLNLFLTQALSHCLSDILYHLSFYVGAWTILGCVCNDHYLDIVWTIVYHLSNMNPKNKQTKNTQQANSNTCNMFTITWKRNQFWIPKLII